MRHSTTSRSIDHQAIASWVFGSILLIFLLGVFTLGPDQLSWPRQKLLAFICALAAGLFTFFFTGTVSLFSERLAVRATGGVAVFVLVLLWWGSPVAPVRIAKISPSDVTARITLRLEGDPGTRAVQALGHILQDRVTVEVRAVAGSLAPTVSTGWIPRHDGFHLEGPTMAVRSSNQRTSELASPSTAGIWIASVRLFDGFAGSVGSLENREEWENAAIEARLTAIVFSDNDILTSLIPDSTARSRFLQELLEPPDVTFNTMYRVAPAEREAWPDYRIFAIPVSAELEVFVSGQPVGSSKGLLVKLIEGDEDVGSTRVIAFPVFRAKLRDE